MRKITEQSIHALEQFLDFKKDNTEVRVTTTGGTATLSLFGNDIAIHKKTEDNRSVFKITNANWQSRTTKERLNGVQGVSICQRAGVWYLNGVPWDGTWTLVMMSIIFLLTEIHQ